MDLKNVCSEIFGLINILDIDEIDRLPQSFLFNVMENINDYYNPTYTSCESFFEDTHTSQEAKITILYCYLKYLCRDYQEKEEIKKLLTKNDMESIQASYKSIDNLFNNKKSTVLINKENNTLLIPKKWYTKFFEFLKKVFIRKL